MPKNAPKPARYQGKEYPRLSEDLEPKLALKIIKAFHKTKDLDELIISNLNKHLGVDFNKAGNPFPTIRFGLSFDLYEIDGNAKFTESISDDEYIVRAKKVLNIDI